MISLTFFQSMRYLIVFFTLVLLRKGNERVHSGHLAAKQGQHTTTIVNGLVTTHKVHIHYSMYSKLPHGQTYLSSLKILCQKLLGPAGKPDSISTYIIFHLLFVEVTTSCFVYVPYVEQILLLTSLKISCFSSCV